MCSVILRILSKSNSVYNHIQGIYLRISFSMHGQVSASLKDTGDQTCDL